EPVAGRGSHSACSALEICDDTGRGSELFVAADVVLDAHVRHVSPPLCEEESSPTRVATTDCCSDPADNPPPRTAPHPTRHDPSDQAPTTAAHTTSYPRSPGHDRPAPVRSTPEAPTRTPCGFREPPTVRPRYRARPHQPRRTARSG